MSLPFMGGMRHINIVPGSVDQACGEVRNLRDDEVQKVLDYVSRLKADRTPGDGPQAGDPGLLPRHAGRFTFNEGEREALLKMVLDAREAGVR